VVQVRRVQISLIVRVSVLLLVALPAIAATESGAGQPPAAPEIVLSRGERISSAIATITSTAISPLLGVCLLGIYDYTRTPAAQRAALPFYGRPYFWIPIGILLILIFLKDSIGSTAPLLKKPLDALEVLMLNKASLILLAFPVMLQQVAKLMGVKSIGGLALLLIRAVEPVAHAADLSPIASAGHAALAAVLVAAGFFVTFVVWLLGHSVDVLALLSPFPFVDLLLKGLRSATLLLVAGTELIDWRFGLAISLVVIGVSVLMFSWALRLAILGALFAWDLIRLMFLGRRPALDVQAPVLGFTAGKIRGLPRQTFGKLTRDANGILEFRYRRLSFGPTRLIRLDDAVDYELGRGLLYPSVVLPYEKGSKHIINFRLLPRYLGSESGVRATLGLGGIRDIRFTRGMRAFWRWAEGDVGNSPG
jgi:hypothetical protein